LGDEGFCDVVVQFVKQDIREDGAEYRALRHARERSVKRMVGGEIALSTANSELCMTLSRHTAPQSMVIWY
jgi:hypothetical protein